MIFIQEITNSKLINLIPSLPVPTRTRLQTIFEARPHGTSVMTMGYLEVLVVMIFPFFLLTSIRLERSKLKFTSLESMLLKGNAVDFRLYYPISILNHVLSVFPQHKVGILYDLGCQLETHVRKVSYLLFTVAPFTGHSCSNQWRPQQLIVFAPNSGVY